MKNKTLWIRSKKVFSLNNMYDKYNSINIINNSDDVIESLPDNYNCHSNHKIPLYLRIVYRKRDLYKSCIYKEKALSIIDKCKY